MFQADATLINRSGTLADTNRTTNLPGMRAHVIAFREEFSEECKQRLQSTLPPENTSSSSLGGVTTDHPSGQSSDALIATIRGLIKHAHSSILVGYKSYLLDKLTSQLVFTKYLANTLFCQHFFISISDYTMNINIQINSLHTHMEKYKISAGEPMKGKERPDDYCTHIHMPQHR